MKVSYEEEYPLWDAIDRGGGQTCNVRGVLREIDRMGFVVVRQQDLEALVNDRNALASLVGIR